MACGSPCCCVGVSVSRFPCLFFVILVIRFSALVRCLQHKHCESRGTSTIILFSWITKYISDHHNPLYQGVLPQNLQLLDFCLPKPYDIYFHKCSVGQNLQISQNLRLLDTLRLLVFCRYWTSASQILRISRKVLKLSQDTSVGTVSQGMCPYVPVFLKVRTRISQDPIPVVTSPKEREKKNTRLGVQNRFPQGRFMCFRVRLQSSRSWTLARSSTRPVSRPTRRRCRRPRRPEEEASASAAPVRRRCTLPRWRKTVGCLLFVWNMALSDFYRCHIRFWCSAAVFWLCEPMYYAFLFWQVRFQAWFPGSGRVGLVRYDALAVGLVLPYFGRLWRKIAFGPENPWFKISCFCGGLIVNYGRVVHCSALPDPTQPNRNHIWAHRRVWAHETQHLGPRVFDTLLVVVEGLGEGGDGTGCRKGTFCVCVVFEHQASSRVCQLNKSMFFRKARVHHARRFCRQCWGHDCHQGTKSGYFWARVCLRPFWCYCAEISDWALQNEVPTASSIKLSWVLKWITIWSCARCRDFVL